MLADKKTTLVKRCGPPVAGFPCCQHWKSWPGKLLGFSCQLFLEEQGHVFFKPGFEISTLRIFEISSIPPTPCLTRKETALATNSSMLSSNLPSIHDIFKVMYLQENWKIIRLRRWLWWSWSSFTDLHSSLMRSLLKSSPIYYHWKNYQPTEEHELPVIFKGNERQRHTQGPCM